MLQNNIENVSKMLQNNESLVKEWECYPILPVR